MGVYRRGKSYYTDFWYEGKRYRERVGPVSESIALEKEAILKSEVIRGQWKPKEKKILFKDFQEEYTKFSLANKDPSTAERDIQSLKHHDPFFGSKLLTEISPFMVEQYKQKRKAEDVSPRTINIELCCLRHMFTMALKWGRLDKSPLKWGKIDGNVRMFKLTEGKDRILSPEEEIRLFEAIRANKRVPYLEPMITTGLETGMRRGELFNLKWTEVDFNNRFITLEDTKNGTVGKIPMSSKLVEILRALKEKSTSEYVFANRKGKPYRNIDPPWERALKDAGIEGVTLHSLRHTFGSRLGMLGTDIKTVQELMRHKDIKMTMRYCHPTAAHKRNAVEMLSQYVTKVPTSEKEAGNIKSVSFCNR